MGVGGEEGAVQIRGRKVSNISKVTSRAAHGAALTTKILTDFSSSQGSIIQACEVLAKN